MDDYIEFLNWPDMDAYYKNKNHPWDNMTLEERYAEYIKMKNKNPKVTDEDLAKNIGKSVHYFSNIKTAIRRKACSKKLLKLV